MALGLVATRFVLEAITVCVRALSCENYSLGATLAE